MTKMLTSIAALKLAQVGVLNLDEPVYKAVDPWLKSQGHASLAATWHGDTTINTVTARMLLSMRSGIPDYDDGALREWTLRNPSKDFLPLDFLHNVSKQFLFAPGKGGAYSGVGYVLMGITLCAVTNCTSWDSLQQQQLIEQGSAFRFRSTRFMTAGPCSRYSPPVVHQYLYSPSVLAMAHRRSTDGAQQFGRARSGRALPTWLFNGQQQWPSPPLPLRGEAETGTPGHCQNHLDYQLWYPGTSLNGSQMASRAVTSGGATACCAAGDGVHGAQYWTFVGHGESGMCYYYSQVSASMKQANATSGRADGRPAATDFVDIYPLSCLNGWTMGNVATTPTDVVRVFHALFSGALISASSLRQMLSFEKFTTGFEPGAAYGLGLFAFPVQIPVEGRSCAGYEAAGCKCRLFRGCHFEADLVGHPGLDYGSGFPIAFFVTGINATIALASNTGESCMGMNTTLGVLENMQLSNNAYCPMIHAATQLAAPGFPSFKCYPYPV